MMNQNGLDVMVYKQFSCNQQVPSAAPTVVVNSMETLEEFCKNIFDECEERRQSVIRDRKRMNRKLSPHSQVNSSERCETSPKSSKRLPADQESPRLNTEDLEQLKQKLASAGVLVLRRYGEPVCLPTSARFFQVDRAMFHVCHHSDRHDLVQSIIRRMDLESIPLRFEAEVEEIWNEATYKIFHSSDKELNSVMRYRLRKRHPCLTMQRSGPKKYNLSPAVRQALLKEFKLNPKPEPVKCEALSKQHGIKIKTTRNWFKNQRQRFKKVDQKHLTKFPLQEFCIKEEPCHNQQQVYTMTDGYYVDMSGLTTTVHAQPQPIYYNHAASSSPDRSSQVDLAYSSSYSSSVTGSQHHQEPMLISYQQSPTSQTQQYAQLCPWSVQQCHHVAPIAQPLTDVKEPMWSQTQLTLPPPPSQPLEDNENELIVPEEHSMTIRNHYDQEMFLLEKQILDDYE